MKKYIMRKLKDCKEILLKFVKKKEQEELKPMSCIRASNCSVKTFNEFAEKLYSKDELEILQRQRLKM